MKKIKLDLDALSVTSFDTDATTEPRAGSVVAHGRIPVEETYYTCETAGPSCYHSACPNVFNTCGYSCDCVTTTGNPVFCH
jgi:hypothetical protein